MSQIYKTQTAVAPPGTVLALQPDSGANVIPTGAGVIQVSGQPSGANQSVPEDNFFTYNAGTSDLQIAHKYQAGGTTVGAATTILLTIPITVASSINIQAQLAGIEATPLGVGGEVRGTVFKGGAGTGVLLGTPDKVVRASAALAGSTFDVSVDGGGNNLLLTVTGIAGKTIEWYVIAEIVVKSFI